jgi:hypothetical protein
MRRLDKITQYAVWTVWSGGDPTDEKTFADVAAVALLFSGERYFHSKELYRNNMPLPPPVEKKPVFTPFVSGIKAEPRNNLIRLSWVDSPDAGGLVYIYRASTPFDDVSSYTLIRPIEVPYGVQSYIDEIEGGGDW